MTSLLTSPSPLRTESNDRDYISFSAISTYQQCPLRYFFKYIEDLPEETVSSSLVLGGAVHSAVEFHFNELMAGNPAPDLDTLLSSFWNAWHYRGEEATVRFGKGEDVNAVAKMADRILAEFRQSDLALPHGNILGVEETLRGELIPGVPDLLARIDLIVETDDTVTITDFKTSRSRWNVSKADDSGEQLLIYSELVRQLIPGKTVRLEFAVVTKAAKPVAERFTVTYAPARIARTKKVVEKVWQAIQQGNYFPAPSPIVCGSCPFKEPCRAWKG